MVTYRLTPINSDHKSWERSTISPKTVWVLAHDCKDARRKVRNATLKLEYRPDLGPHAPAAQLQTSPWQLAEITSCEPDASALPPPPDQVVTEDGAHWPVRP
jgi:hypothetical protein